MARRFENNYRQELIVYLNRTKKVYPLKKYGYVYYVSRRMNYAILYVNSDRADETIERLLKLPFVDRVERSKQMEIDMDFSAALDGEEERAEEIKRALDEGREF